MKTYKALFNNIIETEILDIRDLGRRAKFHAPFPKEIVESIEASILLERRRRFLELAAPRGVLESLWKSQDARTVRGRDGGCSCRLTRFLPIFLPGQYNFTELLRTQSRGLCERQSNIETTIRPRNPVAWKNVSRHEPNASRPPL